MFNTFIGVIPDDSINPTERRRTIVSKACVECRRRKTKCIGTHPCSGCIACNVECVFPEFRRRGRKSQKQTAKPTEKEDCENIVKLLFPNSSIQSLRGLSREALLERAKLEGELSPTSNGSSSVASPAHAITPMSFPGSDSQPQLQDIQRQGSIISQWDETSQWSGQEGEEDTSAFALSPDGNSTFQGIGTITQYQFSERFYVPELFSSDWQYSNHNGQSIHLGSSYIEDQPFLPPYNSVYPS